jgi:cellulose biosynthesis protein BcsQ
VIPATLSSRTLAQLEKMVDGQESGGAEILAFFSMVDTRKRLHREVIARLSAERASMLETSIPASAEIERMGVQRDLVAAFAPRGRAARAYEALWAEVRTRLGEG